MSVLSPIYGLITANTSNDAMMVKFVLTWLSYLLIPIIIVVAVIILAVVISKSNKKKQQMMQMMYMENMKIAQNLTPQQSVQPQYQQPGIVSEESQPPTE